MGDGRAELRSERALGLALTVEETILGLDIPVADPVPVQVFLCACNMKPCVSLSEEPMHCARHSRRTETRSGGSMGRLLLRIFRRLTSPEMS